MASKKKKASMKKRYLGKQTNTLTTLRIVDGQFERTHSYIGLSFVPKYKNRREKAFEKITELKPFEPGMISEEDQAKLKGTRLYLAQCALFYDHGKHGERFEYYGEALPEMIIRSMPVAELLMFDYYPNFTSEFRMLHKSMKHKGVDTGTGYGDLDGLIKDQYRIRDPEDFKKEVEKNDHFGFESIEDFIRVVDKLNELRW